MSSQDSNEANQLKIAFIGFGEAATAIVDGWDEDGPFEGIQYHRVFDIAKSDTSRQNEFAKRCDTKNVINCATVSEAISNANIIFSLVTADQTLIAAKNAIASISKGTFYFDCNSSAPETKRKAAALITSAGGRYIDVAIMSPIYPQKHKSPMLICGQAAKEAAELLIQLHMNPTIIEGDIGKASAIKMVRSVMVKGMEALMAECALASRRAGISEYVFASLEKTYPGIEWLDKCEYNLERMSVHGKRRAAEMREAAKTVAELGLINSMSRATVDWQQLVGDLGVDPKAANFYERTDNILEQIDISQK